MTRVTRAALKREPMDHTTGAVPYRAISVNSAATPSRTTSADQDVKMADRNHYQDEDDDYDFDSQPNGHHSVPHSHQSASTNGRSTTNGHSSTTTAGPSRSAPNNERRSSSPSSASGIEALRSKSKALISAIQRLGGLNIDTTLPSLPKFVIIGDQSAGKSSIIEAVCDITLPRSDGTCTRCPFQITTTEAKDGSPWTCKIRLLQRWSYNPKSKKTKPPPNGYLHWVEKAALETDDFVTVYDKRDLGDALLKAQFAILNPGRDAQGFVDAPLDSMEAACEFSPNVVSLEISGPNLPELSLYDLPGAINRHPDEEQQYLVEFIRTLTMNYLKDDKALVLLACASNTDVETSTAFNWLGQCKGIGRTTGVLTKPDLMDNTRVAAIRKILNNEQHKLGHAWFVTKQCSQGELDDGITHAEARLREEEFFRGWKKLASFGSRFGIPKLQDAISERLTEHIRNSLPDIEARVRERLDEVNADLATFPQRSTSAASMVRDEIARIAEDVKSKVMNEDLDRPEFRKDYKNLIKQTQTKLKEHRPVVVLRTPGYTQPSFSVEDESEEMDVDESPPKRVKTNSGGSQPITPTINRRSTATPGPSQGSTRRGKQRADAPTATPQAERAPTKMTFRLDEVQQRLEDGSGTSLPDQANPKVKERLVLDSIRGWKAIIARLVFDVKIHLSKTLESTINEKLEKWTETDLLPETKGVVNKFFRQIIAEQTTVIEHLVNCELYKPIMYNPTFRSVTELNRKKLTDERLKERLDEYLDPLDAQGQKVPKGPERQKKLADAQFIAQTLGPDDYRREVDALATPLAYYDIASARLLDSVANHFEYGVLRALSMELKQALREGLKVDDEEHCLDLLQEDPTQVQKRKDLSAEKERLTAALEELEGLI